MAYAVEIYRLSAQFPDTERYNLTVQLRKAATSVPLNIAEGSGCQANGEFALTTDNDIKGEAAARSIRPLTILPTPR